MNKRILLGIDAPISPATQHALRSMGEFVEQAAPLLQVVLLHVIPIPYFSSPALGMSAGHMPSTFFTSEQRSLAEEALRDATAELLKQGINAGQIETLIYTGVPADQITKAAIELQVDFIIVGSRGHSSKQKIRRFFTGSTSRSILQLAHCPVMIVSYPHMRQSGDLVVWYEKSIRHYLQERTSDLTVLSPQEVAQMFVPPGKKAVGRKEIAAAILALEQLAQGGTLCRHDIKGEMKYVND
jgi:nucleotide-binding universal stress UspA family protein